MKTQPNNPFATLIKSRLLLAIGCLWSATVMGAGGASNATIFVSRFDDELVEGTETMRLALVVSPPSYASNFYVIGEPSTATAYIIDNDAPNNLPPVITMPPASRRNYVGESATFNVTATGTPPLTYQWQFNPMVRSWSPAATPSGTSFGSTPTGVPIHRSPSWWTASWWTTPSGR